MSTIRCFVGEQTKLAPGSRCLISKQESHHLLRVLRVRPSDSVRLMNGHGEIADATVCGKIGDLVELQIGAVSIYKRSRLVLCQALLKNKAMDLVIRDASALGVAKILPLVTERTEVKFDKKSATSKLLHWRAIAIESCKQSGEAFVPEILNPVAIESFLFLNTFTEISIVGSLYSTDEKRITDYQTEICNAQTVNLIIGPEGDFSQREYEMMLTRGVKFIRLTQNILRSETAALCLLSLTDQIALR
ncbi:MAG: 16S rRNA (uracil(1498)-N(3))-methyltransferase [Puniceicoccales bacterium]|nr:16S rRNA (uracil(1498)-N(3))-methyltransferase [Puniceicoccales bacterium]